MKTLLVIPAYNEQDNIVSLINKIDSFGYDYLVINDCSKDNTEKILKKCNINYLNNIYNIKYC